LIDLVIDYAVKKHQTLVYGLYPRIPNTPLEPTKNLGGLGIERYLASHYSWDTVHRRQYDRLS